MATILKPTRPYALPANPEIVDKDGKPHVRVRVDGRAALYPLTKDRKKYLKPAEKWYAKYRDANGANAGAAYDVSSGSSPAKNRMQPATRAWATLSL